MPTSTITPVATKTKVHGVHLEIAHYPKLSDDDKAPLVLLHEGLGSVAMWRDFPAQLHAATGRAVWVYSRRGYGLSDAVADVRGAGRLPPDYMHTEAWQVLPELLRICGITEPVLLGHSDGGTIALLYAARHQASACIVMAPHLFVEEISIQSITVARDAFEKGDLRSRLAKYHTDVDGAFWQWNDVWLSDAFRSFNIEEECKKITCPLLAIQGFDDPYGTMSQIDQLGGEEYIFSGKNSPWPARNQRRVLLKLEQCGHSPQRDQPKAVIHAVTQLLQSMRK